MNQRKLVSTLIPDRTHFRTRKIIGDKGEYCTRAVGREGWGDVGQRAKSFRYAR